MEAGIGQKYVISSPQAGIGLTAGIAEDLFVITPAANIPVLVERIVCTSPYNAAGTQLAQLVKRSTAGSGGVGLVIAGDPPSTPAVALSANGGVATLGSLKAAYEIEEWQLFSSLEFNFKPGARLITPGESLCLFLPAVITGGFTAFFRIEAIEVK